MTDFGVRAAIILDFSTTKGLVRGSVAVYHGCFTFKTQEVADENSIRQAAVRPEPLPTAAATTTSAR